MAITIQQSPTFPNIANNYLVYVVTSTEIAQPQYQFVLDIRDIDGNLVQRLKQQPNPSGKGVFDIGHLVSQQFNDLSQPQFSDLISDNASNPIINGGLWNQRYTFSFNNAGFLREFNVYFGEEYGTSTTSVVTLYNGAGVAGDPSVTSTTEYQSYLGGVLDTNGRYPIWEPSWNFTSLYDYTSWSVNKFYLYPGVFATAEYDGQGASTVGTPRGMRTGEGKWVPQPWWGVGSVIVDNWNLYIGDPYSQAFNFNIGLTKFPNEVKYGRLFREFYLYGDKVAKPQKLYWDDAYSLSFLSGQATPPSQSEGYIQNGQWIDTAFFQPEYKDTGFAPNFGEIEVQRNWLNYTTGGNFPWWVYNSASIKDNLTHLNVSVNSMNGFAGSLIKNPVNNPNDYTTGFELILPMRCFANAHNFTGVPYSASDWPGYEPAEAGSQGFNGTPMVFMSPNAGDPLGPYPASTAKIHLQGHNGVTATIHFTQSDAYYSPSLEFPIASPIQIQNDINSQSAAQGSSIRAYLVKNEQPQGSVDFSHIPGYGYNLLITDDLEQDTIYTDTKCYTGVIAGEEDAFGLPVNEDLGVGTGQYGYSSLFNFAGFYSGSDDFYQYYSTWDRRRYEIDWDGYEQFIFAKTPEEVKSCRGYKRRQFAWINEYGVYDYFTFTLAESTTDNIERKDYKQTFVDFSSNTNTLNFDPSRRGKTQYQNKPVQNYTVESDWLDQEEADYLREMFFSTNVVLLEKVWQIKNNGFNEEYNFQSTSNSGRRFSLFENEDYPYQTTSNNFLSNQVNPVSVVITNATITEKTNPRSQKMFRYTVEYQFSNDLNPRV